MMDHGSVDSHEQVAACDLEPTRELDDRAQPRISLGTLKPADLGEMHAADPSKRFLRQTGG